MSLQRLSRNLARHANGPFCLQADSSDLVVRLNGSPVDVKAVLPSSTPDPARLANSHVNSPAIPCAGHMQSARKRKDGDAHDAAEADKENAQSSNSQGASGSMPFGSLKLKRARANSTLETYGNGHGEQVSPLRRLSNMNISTPFSGSPLIREPQANGNDGSPYLAAQYSPAMLPTWSTGNISSPIHPGSGFQAYPAAGPGPAMTESIKKRTQARPSTGPAALRPSSATVSRLPLPSLNLPQQDNRSYSISAEYYSTSAAPSPVMMQPVQPVYYSSMPQHQSRGMVYGDVGSAHQQPHPHQHAHHLARADANLSHSPFLVSTPVHPPVSSLAYPYAMQTQPDGMAFYDAFSPMPGGALADNGMFAFTPTLAGEQVEVPEDEYVWTQTSQ